MTVFVRLLPTFFSDFDRVVCHCENQEADSLVPSASRVVRENRVYALCWFQYPIDMVV